MIHFSNEGTLFCVLYADREWVEIGRLGDDEPWDCERLEIIRNRAIRLCCGHLATTVMVYPELINFTQWEDLEGESATSEEIERHLVANTGEDIEHIFYDAFLDGHSRHVAYAARDDIENFTQFVVNQGFPVVGFGVFQNDRQDLPSHVVLGVSEHGKQQNVMRRDIRQALSFSRHSSGETMVQSSGSISDREIVPVGESRPIIAAAAICLSFALALGAAEAADGVNSEIAVPSHSQPTPTSAQNLTAFVESYDLKIIGGWDSAIGSPTSRLTPARVKQVSADRGFDPNLLVFETLNLTPSLAPQGHDLKERENPIRSGGNELAQPDPSSVSDNNERQAESSLLSSETIGATEINSDVKPATAAQELPIDSVQQVSGAEEILKPLNIKRPVFRDGARDLPTIFATTRPVLRDGGRDKPSEVAAQTADSDTQESTDALIRNAILERLEAEVEPQTRIISRPARRPTLDLPTQITDTQTVLVRPLRRPNQTQSSPRVAALPATPIPTESLRSNALATVQTDLDLGKINLIGIHGQTDFLRALVRLPNGELRNLYVGSSVEGGKVVEITNSSMTYIKDNERLRLTLPN